MWYFVTADEKELHLFTTLEDAIDHRNIDDKMVMHTYNPNDIKDFLDKLEIVDHTN